MHAAVALCNVDRVEEPTYFVLASVVAYAVYDMHYTGPRLQQKMYSMCYCAIYICMAFNAMHAEGASH